MLEIKLHAQGELISRAFFQQTALNHFPVNNTLQLILRFGQGAEGPIAGITRELILTG